MSQLIASCGWAALVREPGLLGAGTATGGRRVMGRSGAEFGAASSQLPLQAADARAVHLAHAAFAELERVADFFHRHLLVVVEDDNQPFVAVQALRDEPHEVGLLD